jgi:glycosyltransferase involved in cell wall biosynthesis
VFVLNSLYEGLSHTLLEVQALGTPIVASDVCGNPEVVVREESGLLVDPRDSEALCRAIARYLDDPAFARRMAEGGRRRRAQFDRAATFGEVEAALRRASGCS